MMIPFLFKSADKQRADEAEDKLRRIKQIVNGTASEPVIRYEELPKEKRVPFEEMCSEFNCTLNTAYEEFREYSFGTNELYALHFIVKKNGIIYKFGITAHSEMRLQLMMDSFEMRLLQIDTTRRIRDPGFKTGEL